jgi:hypothetical protein
MGSASAATIGGGSETDNGLLYRLSIQQLLKMTETSIKDEI